MIDEARLERIASGLVPVTPGWFVVNTADAAWVNNEAYGGVCIFESDDIFLQGRPDLTQYEKPEAGFTIRVVPPGQPVGLYHAESVQEDFLILMGECVLVIEDQERHLKAWDFVHCPPLTGHTFIATGDGPCVILATGNRRDDFEVVEGGSEVAHRYDAGSAVVTTEPERRGRWEVRHPERWDELPWAERQ
jgi:mannose-6-phosphate isomerase-like protein (cupin superfamily)